jgi:hypothetical protein
MTLAVAISIVALLSALLGFFYQKDGTRYRIGGIGYAILFLIFTISGLNIYSVIQGNLDGQKAKAKALQLESEARFAQSSLLLQFLEYKEPFTFGQISFSIYEKSEEFPDRIDSIFGKENLIIFPIPKESNREIGRIQTLIEDSKNVSLMVKTDENGSPVVEQDYEDQKFSNITYPIDTPTDCGDEKNEKKCDSERRNRILNLEWLAGIDGDHHLIIGLPQTAEVPALETISRLLQIEDVAVLDIKNGPNKKNDPNEVVEFFNRNINSKLYFVQDYAPNSPLESCKRTAMLPLNAFLAEKDSYYFGDYCEPGDTCIVFRHQRNLSVNACQISEF